MQFDISNLDVNSLSTAKVSLYAASGNMYCRGLDIYDLGDVEWNENELTWENAPITYLTGLTPVVSYEMQKFNENMVYQQYKIDLTELVKAKVGQGQTILNLMMMPSKEGYTLNIHSKEADEVNTYAPKLILTSVENQVDPENPPEEELYTYSYQAAQDGYISEKSFNHERTTAFTGSQEVLQALLNSGSPSQRNIYMQFDISNLNAYQISTAAISLYAASGNMYCRGLDIYDLGNVEWNENELTWENAPVTYLTGLTPVLSYQMQKFNENMVYKQYEIDLTELVKTKVSQGQTILNLMMMPSKEGYTLNIHSKEADEVNTYAPEIIIRTTQDDFVPPVQDDTVKTGDVNSDGKTDQMDLVFIALNYGKTSANEEWSEIYKADLDGDGKIDLTDIIMLVRKLVIPQEPTGTPTASPTPVTTGIPTATPTPVTTGIPTATPIPTPSGNPTVTPTPSVNPGEIGTYEIPVRQDAYISQNKNGSCCSTVFNGINEPLMSFTNTSSKNSTLTYLQFDLRSIDADHCTSAFVEICAATAQVNYRDVNLVDLGDITWYEDALTWNIAPVTDTSEMEAAGTLTMTKYDEPKVFANYRFDLTELILAKKREGKEFLNVAITPTRQMYTLYIQSKENANGNETPAKLIIGQSEGWETQEYIDTGVGSGVPVRKPFDPEGEIIRIYGYNSNLESGEIRIYDYRNGETTGASQYCVELVCNADGIVIKRDGTNNEIPKDGFVVVGHGSGPTQNGTLLSSIPMDSFITYNLETLEMCVKKSDTPLPPTPTPYPKGVYPLPEIKSFTTTKSEITLGETIEFYWEIEGAETVQLRLPREFDVIGKSSYTFTPSVSMEYTLVAWNIAGEASQAKVQIDVTIPDSDGLIYEWPDYIMEDQMEYGDFHMWDYTEPVNGVMELTDEQVYSGEMSTKFTLSSAAETKNSYLLRTFRDMNYNTTITYPELYGRCFFLLGDDFEVAPGEQVTIFTPYNSNIPGALSVENRDGKLFLCTSDKQGAIGKGTTELQRGQWYCLGFYIKTALNREAEFRVTLDGIDEIYMTGFNIFSSMWGVIAGAYYTGNSAETRGSLYIDDVFIDTKPIVNPKIRLYAPDFRGRIGVKTVVMLSDYQSTDRLAAILTSNLGFSRTYYNETNIQNGKIEILNDIRNLPAATYTYTVTLTDANGFVKERLDKTFIKTYDGDPKEYSIDEYNNITFNGEKVFIVTSFGLAANQYKNWYDKGYINMTMGATWGLSSGAESYKAMIEQGNADAPEARNIGPTFDTALDRVQPDGSKGGRWNPILIQNYIDVCKDSQALAWWCWREEPDNFGYRSPEVKTWWDMIKLNTPSMLTETLLMGYNYVSRETGAGWRHSMRNYHWPYLVADFYSQDTYPVENEPLGYGFDKFADVIDQSRLWNMDLVPVFPNIQTTDVTPSNVNGGDVDPTVAEFNHMCWSMVIHGAKGIHWYHYSGITKDEIYEAMAKFVSDVENLTDVILGYDRTKDVSMTLSNGGRVDYAVKTDGSDVYLFAANIRHENETAAFTLGNGLSASYVEVYREDRTIPVVNGTFVDEYSDLAYHIYKLVP